LPTGTLVFPQPGKIYNSNTWTTISGTSSDVGSGVQKTEVLLCKAAGERWTGSSWTGGGQCNWGSGIILTGTSWSLNVPTASMDFNGQYSLYTRVFDNYGNVSPIGDSTGLTSFTYDKDLIYYYANGSEVFRDASGIINGYRGKIEMTLSSLPQSSVSLLEVGSAGSNNLIRIRYGTSATPIWFGVGNGESFLVTSASNTIVATWNYTASSITLNEKPAVTYTPFSGSWSDFLIRNTTYIQTLKVYK